MDFSYKMNVCHPWQLKRSKFWGPSWSYQLNNTTNVVGKKMAHFLRELFLVASQNIDSNWNCLTHFKHCRFYKYQNVNMYFKKKNKIVIFASLVTIKYIAWTSDYGILWEKMLLQEWSRLQSRCHHGCTVLLLLPGTYFEPGEL